MLKKWGEGRLARLANKSPRQNPNLKVCYFRQRNMISNFIPDSDMSCDMAHSSYIRATQ
jgi:hypothetical protein